MLVNEKAERVTTSAKLVGRNTKKAIIVRGRERERARRKQYKKMGVGTYWEGRENSICISGLSMLSRYGSHNT